MLPTDDISAVDDSVLVEPVDEDISVDAITVDDDIDIEVSLEGFVCGTVLEESLDDDVPDELLGNDVLNVKVCVAVIDESVDDVVPDELLDNDVLFKPQRGFNTNSGSFLRLYVCHKTL